MIKKNLEVTITDKNAVFSIRKIAREEYDRLIDSRKADGWQFEKENEDCIFFSKDGWFMEFCKSANCWTTARMDNKIKLNENEKTT